MDLTRWENRLLNHATNKIKDKEILKLKKVFKNRSKWSIMSKQQKILLVCLKLTEQGAFEINKKQIGEICDCATKYVEQLFVNSESIKRKTKQNLVFNNFETIVKKKQDEHYLAFSKRFFISRKTNFNYLDVLLELKGFLSSQEKHSLKIKIESINLK